MSSHSDAASEASAGSHDSHYNDWPNTQGFDTSYEEQKPIELPVSGDIPSYAAGVLFRTGIGPRDVYDRTTGERKYRANHWFDALSQVHRFQIHAPTSSSDTVKVTYNSRLTTDGLIERLQNGGKLETFSFAARYDPCRTVFNKVSSIFTPEQKVRGPNENINAVSMSINYPGISASGDALHQSHKQGEIVTLCNKSDIDRLQMLDPETLEPIGLAHQRILHPDLKGQLSATHAKSDPISGDVYNFNLEVFGPSSPYRVFRTSASTGKTCILATIKHNPAYLHSFFLTKNYIILCIWNSHFVAGGVSILYNKNLAESMYTNLDQPATWYVIDKRDPLTEGGKGLVAIYESDPFFAFHTVNAYEESNASDAADIDIVADIPIWPDMEVVRHFVLDNMMSNGPGVPTSPLQMPSKRPRLTRFRLSKVPQLSAEPSQKPSKPKSYTSKSLPSQKCIIDFKLETELSMELPTLNFNNITHRHKYVYGIAFGDGTGSSFVDKLIKVNLDTKEKVEWTKHGHTPGEALFVPRPGATEEDDGVLLTVVLNGHTGCSYLLVLDGKTFTEVGRADVPGAIGFGFHGVFTNYKTKGEIAAQSETSVQPQIHH